jgi:anti-sigma B factor antagonist
MPVPAGSPIPPWPSDEFAASTEQLDSGTPVISVTGELDLATVPALERTLRSAAEGRRGEVIVDLTACSFFDARGLALLNETRARLARSNRVLALVLTRPTDLKIFRITGFDRRFPIYPSLRAAVDANTNAHV